MEGLSSRTHLAPIQEQPLSSRQRTFVFNPTSSVFAPLTGPSTAPAPTPVPGSLAKMELPKAFYDLPADACAVFSTTHGRYPKRNLPEPLPLCITRSNVALDVEMKADALWEPFYYDIYNSLRRPGSWYDLHQWFDAVDLHIEGATFCYFVLLNLFERMENHKHKTAQMIDKFAKEWAHDNRQYASLPPEINIMDSHPDFDTSNLSCFRPHEIDTLRLAIQHYLHAIRLQLEEQALMRIQQPPRAFNNGHSHGYPIYQHSRQDQRGNRRPSMSQNPARPFMDSQRPTRDFQPFIHNGNAPPSETRARGFSNEFRRGGRGGRYTTFNDRRSAQNSPRQPMKEPVYMLRDQNQRNFSDPAHGYSPAARGMLMDHSRSVSSFQLGQPPDAGGKAILREAPAQGPTIQVSNRQSNGPISGEQQRTPDPVFIKHHNENVTLVYDGETKERDKEKQQDLTVFVRNFHSLHDWYASHYLKRLLSNCGKVVAVTYAGLNPPVAFVEFKQSSSATEAIQKYDKLVIAPGIELMVHRPRARSGSLTSVSSYAMSYPSPHRGPVVSRDFRSTTPYHHSHIRTNSGLSDMSQIRQGFGEMRHHLPPRPQLPLGSIENLPTISRNTLYNEQLNMAGPRKENSPIKAQGQATKGNKKKKKGSNQNTSTQPTPAVSPHKPGSPARFSEDINQLQRISTFALKEDVHLLSEQMHESPPSRTKKKGKKSKNWQKKFSKSDGGYPESVNASFCTDGSDAASPVDSVATSDRHAFTTRNTSFSTISSKKANAALSDSGRLPDNSIPRGQKNKDSECASEIGSPASDAVGAEKSAMANHSKKGSLEIKSTSVRKADAAKVSNGKHMKTTRSRITDLAPKKPKETASEAGSANVGAPASGHCSVLPQNPIEIPAAKVDAKSTPLSVTSDKTPIASAEKSKVRTTPIPIAVPRIFLPRTQSVTLNNVDVAQSRVACDSIDLGSETWPFIKSCRPL